MPIVIKNFRCFKCKFHNSVKVPQHFKGIKCKNCRIFNYFNYIPNYKRRQNVISNLNNNRNIHVNIPIRKTKNNNNNSNNILNFNLDNNMTFGSFNRRNNDRIININNNINRITNDIPILLNNPIENFFDFRSPVYNNHINLNTNFSNNLISFNYNDMYNINEKIKFPWLNKQKMTEEIKKKYKNEKCSICLDEFSGDISISKCHHIFHYKCISSYIDNTDKKDCPICRSNLQTGEKKRIEVNRNIYEGRINENIFLSDFMNRNIYLNNQNNQNLINNQRRVTIVSNNNVSNQINSQNRSFLPRFLSNLINKLKNIFC